MSFLYVTTKGWKTGKPHTIEIWYVKHEGRYYIVSEMRGRAHWVQNIANNPGVHVKVGRDQFPGRGRILDGKKDPELIKTVAKLMQQKYGWNEGTIVELTTV